MPKRLKVFITSDGLTDYVVAVSSKAKALEAWGIHQDVFKSGQAHQTDDAGLVDAATAKPGKVFRRPAGSRDTLARLKAPKVAKGPSKAQQRRVADLEAKLAALDVAHESAAAELERQRSVLDQTEERLHARHEARRDKLKAQLSAARARA